MQFKGNIAPKKQSISWTDTMHLQRAFLKSKYPEPGTRFFWGYLHTNGNKVLKRYFEGGWSKSALAMEAKSDFVQVLIGPFMASSQRKAIKILKNNIHEYNKRNR